MCHFHLPFVISAICTYSYVPQIFFAISLEPEQLISPTVNQIGFMKAQVGTGKNCNIDYCNVYMANGRTFSAGKDVSDSLLNKVF